MSTVQVDTKEVVSRALLQCNMQVRLSFLCLAARLMSCNDINKQPVTEELKSVRQIVECQLPDTCIPMPDIMSDGSLFAGNLSEDAVQSFLVEALEYSSVQVALIENYSRKYLGGVLPLAEYPAAISEAIVPSVYALWLFFAQQRHRYGDSTEARPTIEHNLESAFGRVSKDLQQYVVQLLPVSWMFATWSLDLAGLVSKALRGLQVDIAHDASKQLRDRFKDRYLVSLQPVSN